MDTDFAVVGSMEWDQAIDAMRYEVPRFLTEGAHIRA